MKKVKAEKSKFKDQKLAKRVMKLFGRGKDKKLFLGLGDMAKAVGREKEPTLPIANYLNSEGKVWILTNYSGEFTHVCGIPKILKYKSWELIQNLNDKYFNQVGDWLKKNLAAKKTITLRPEDLVKYQDELHLPDRFIAYLFNCFVDYRLISERGQVLSLAAKNAELTASKLRSIAIGKEIAEIADKKEPAIGDADVFTTLKKLYDKHNRETRIKTIPIEVEDFFRIQHLCEIKLGHQDLACVELEMAVIALETMDKARRPHILVVSGLIQGSFQNWQKRRRLTLVNGLKSDGAQLAIAKKLMARLTAIGIKVIVNLGEDDKILCENTAYLMLEAMKNDNAPDSKKRSLSYIDMDRLKGSKMYDVVYDFIWYVAIEYMLRIGRRLRSADEVEKISNGAVRMEESIMLFKACQTLAKGELLSSDHASILEVNKIPLPGKVFNDFTVVDDCLFDVLIKNRATGKEKRLSIMEKHFFRLTASGMVSDPTKAIRNILAQLNSMGDEKPDVVFLEHEQQPFLFYTGKSLIASTPGMQNSNIYHNGLHSSVQLDPLHRILTTRKEVVGAGTMPITIFQDGSIEALMSFRHYLEKASISDRRIAIVFFADWHTGSDAAKSDLLVKFMDYCLHGLLPNYPTWLLYGGDMIQGNNYPTHVFENARMGLLSPDLQKKFNKNIICLSLSGAAKKDLIENLKGVRIVPGNHEWNSGYKWPGVIHCDLMEAAFELGLTKAGVYDPADLDRKTGPIVKVCDSMHDLEGNHFKVFAGHEDIGGYGIDFQHLLVEKGGGQGGLPIFALKSILNGISGSKKNTDFLATGNWHNPELWKLGNVTATISGSGTGGTGFEHFRALCSTFGATIFLVGGGLAPAVRSLNEESLINWPMRGFFSEAHLNEFGFKTDASFDRHKHGFARFEGQPQSALQKILWSMIDKLNWDPGSTFG
jgi:hypothetical protein